VARFRRKWNAGEAATRAGVSSHHTLDSNQHHDLLLAIDSPHIIFQRLRLSGNDFEPLLRTGADTYAMACAAIDLR
jgi:hypothetical protein